MGSVTITNVYSPFVPLASIDKKDWPQAVDRKATFAQSALNSDLTKALEILDELESNEAWTCLNMDKNAFLKYRMHIDPPEKLYQIRAGYSLMNGQCLTADEAIKAQEGRENRIKADNRSGAGRGHTASELARQEAILSANKRPAYGRPFKLKQGTNNVSYLLRRLAKMEKTGSDILKRYESGDFKSVRAAAIAAGIITPPSPLDLLRSTWKKASQAEKEIFKTEIKQKENNEKHP